MNQEWQWQAVYEEQIHDVRRFLMYFIQNMTEVDDLVHETFVRAFRNWHRVDRHSSVKTWIFTIARNLAVDHVRKKRRTQLLQRLLQVQPVEQPPLPDEWVRSDERKQTLYQAIRTLPDTYRMVIILRGIQELPPTETAEVLDWSVNKVNVNYHRALKSLRKRIEGEEVFGEYVK